MATDKDGITHDHNTDPKEPPLVDPAGLPPRSDDPPAEPEPEAPAE